MKFNKGCELEMNKRTRKKVGKNKLLIIVTLILISSALVGTIAYLFDYYGKVNGFELGVVKTEIVEDLNSGSGERSNISIKNIGNVQNYIRASVLLYFENNNGEIISVEPVEGKDYSIEYFTSNNQELSTDGYYYYKIPVNPNETTDVLIENFKIATQYEDKKLILDIVTQAIQAEPITAVEDAWAVSLENNEIVI